MLWADQLLPPACESQYISFLSKLVYVMFFSFAGQSKLGKSMLLLLRTVVHKLCIAITVLSLVNPCRGTQCTWVTNIYFLWTIPIAPVVHLGYGNVPWSCTAHFVFNLSCHWTNSDALRITRICVQSSGVPENWRKHNYWCHCHPALPLPVFNTSAS